MKGTANIYARSIFQYVASIPPYPDRRPWAASTASSPIATPTPSLSSWCFYLPYQLPSPFPHTQSGLGTDFASRQQPCPLACSRLNCSLSSDLHTADLTLPRSTRPRLHAHASISTEAGPGRTAPLHLPTENLKSKHIPHQNRSGSSLPPACLSIPNHL
ncbi:hypothetical protein N431DRAFT_437821 [Stipitochalara longipes BDJ]|nr:hypothetical protein N431DRAFT_437821 [Stipitochalara longipes BDJ]